jgi:hypothetical protein
MNLFVMILYFLVSQKNLNSQFLNLCSKNFLAPFIQACYLLKVDLHRLLDMQ